MNSTQTRVMLGASLAILLFTGIGFGESSPDIGKFVKARIEIGEMMTNYFSGGRNYGGGRPSSDQMRDMRTDINTKLSQLLAKHDLTLEEYKLHSSTVFADDTAVQDYLNQHPDLKKRYKALPFDRMGGGRSGRGY